MTRGVIAAGGPLTADAGAEILRRGGNAADAAVAAAFAAFHVEPLMASAAGGGMMIAGSPADGFSVLDFIPAMPGLGLETRPELDFHPIPIDFGVTRQLFRAGRGSAAVPTALAGLHEAHRRWGRLPLADIVAPAVRSCRDGIEIDEIAAGFIQLLQPIWSVSPGSAELFSVGGRPARAGDRLRNPHFADVLDRLAAEGPAPFYSGEVARRTVAGFGPGAGGLLTARDLATYAPRALTPLEVPLFGGMLLTPPPPSTGGTLIALALAALERQGIGSDELGAARHLGAVVDAQLLTLAARRELLERGTFTRDAASRLLSADGLTEQLTRFGRVRPGRVGDVPARGSTTHISVLDADGGAAAITISNGEGCGHVVPGTGMVMNNFLGEEDINPRGFHAEPAGAPLTSMMAPTIFVRDGRPELVLGSGGSNRLRTAILQVVFNRLGLGCSLGAAVRAGRIHVEENHFFAESEAGDEEKIRELSREFDRVDVFPSRSLFFGGVHSVARERDGALIGVGDSRRGGAVREVVS